MKILKFIILLIFLNTSVFAQNNVYERLEFLIGHWQGTGSGFGNETSKIKSEFNLIMNGKYIEIKNDSKFDPTEKDPEGEHHIDWGIVSYDKSRKQIVYRQFNIEGYVNQYVMSDSLSDDTTLVFETEEIENFVKGGRTKWTIKKLSQNGIETVFEVSFPGKEFTCFGTNRLLKKE